MQLGLNSEDLKMVNIQKNPRFLPFMAVRPNISQQFTFAAALEKSSCESLPVPGNNELLGTLNTACYSGKSHNEKVLCMSLYPPPLPTT